MGEIVGKTGVQAATKLLPRLKEELQFDFAVANGNGVTGGFGIGKNHAIMLSKKGIDIITSGECVYYKKDMIPFISKAPFLLRPANYPPGSPGRGWGIFEKEGKTLGLINLLGQSGYDRVHPSNPFSYVNDLIEKVKTFTPHILINFHAPTTAEKKTMAAIVDGHASAIIGTGAKALTADGRISGRGTAAITDAGRCGGLHSVGGFLPDIEIQKFMNQIPERSKDPEGTAEFQGVFLELNEQGQALNMQTLRRTYPDKEP